MSITCRAYLNPDYTSCESLEYLINFYGCLTFLLENGSDNTYLTIGVSVVSENAWDILSKMSITWKLGIVFYDNS
jgi:hypothetical protein